MLEARDTRSRGAPATARLNRGRGRRIIHVPEVPRGPGTPTVQMHAQRFALAFAAVVLIGWILLALPFAAEEGRSTSLVDALFTSISAASVTGLIVVDTQEHWSFFGEFVILVLMQIGGLGFMVGASLVLAAVGRGASLRDALMLQDGEPTLSVHEARDLSLRIMRFIFVCEGVGALLLTIRFWRDESPLIAIWYGVFHSVSAFCNAGFDLEGGYRSMARYETSPWMNAVLFALIQAGALSYMVLADAWNTRRWRRFSLDTKLVLLTNAVLVVGGAALFLMSEWRGTLAPAGDAAKPMIALFQSASMRTSGITTVPFGDVHPPTEFLSVALMVVGGASGSTAGGIKLATLAVIVIAVISTLRGETETQAFGRRIPASLVFRAMAIVAVYLAAHFTFTLILAFTEDVVDGRNLPFLALMVETMSATATTGLTTGIVPSLSGAGKLVLCLAMCFGRLGPLTLVYALTRRQQQTRYRYPESPVRMG